MTDGPGAWRGRPPQVWVLIVMVLLGSALCLAGALRPATPQTPTSLNAIGAILGPVLAILLWWPAPGTHTRTQTVRVHVSVIAKLAIAYLLVAEAATGEGAMAAAMATVWIGLYTSAFHPRPVSRAYLIASALGLGVALASNPIIRSGPAAWLVITVSTVVASEVYSRLLHRARESAVTDHLTGLLNREGLYQRIDREIRLSARHGRPLALAVIDLDGFKQINDHEGHLAGDRLLWEVAEHLRGGIREVDGAFRMGGDEFLLLLPETMGEEAERVLARLRATSPVAWSHGVVTIGPGDGLDSGLARADQRMYVNKQRSPGSRRAAAARALIPADAVAAAQGLASAPPESQLIIAAAGPH